LARWGNYFTQLLNVPGNSDVRQTEIHTAESLVPETSAFEVEMAIEKLKRHKSPGIDQIPADLTKAGSRKIFSDIHKILILFGTKRNSLSSERNQSLYLFIRLHIQRKLLGIISVAFDVKGQILMIYSAFVKYLIKMGNK
jgi:hypothetical protein